MGTLLDIEALQIFY